MQQDRQTSHHKLKAILESLNSNTARQVLKELDQPNPKVKKNLLYELITEISNLTDLDYIQKQIRDKDEIIQLQKISFQNYKAYTLNLENHYMLHMELFLASMQQSQKDYSIIPELKQIQQNQNQDPKQFLDFQEQFEELIQKSCHLNQIIQLLQKQIQDQQHYIQKLEIRNIELCSSSIKNYNDLQYKIFDGQCPELQNIIEHSKELQEQQTKLFQNNLQQENYLIVLTNSNHENQDLQKIHFMISSFIQQTEKILQATKKCQLENEYYYYNKDIQEYIKDFINIVEKNQYFFTKLEKSLSEKNKYMSKHAKLLIEIDQTYQKINRANTMREQIEQFNKIKENHGKKEEQNIK